jgi:hypothetical protein
MFWVVVGASIIGAWVTVKRGPEEGLLGALVVVGLVTVAVALHNGLERSARLTLADLAPLFTMTGCPFEADREYGGTPWYHLKVRRSGCDVVVTVGLSPDGGTLWLVCTLRELPPDGGDLGRRLRALLVANSVWSPYYFALHEHGSWLTLNRPVENRAITPVLFRAILDQFLDILFATQALWDTTQWEVPPAALVTPADPVQMSFSDRISPRVR